MDNLLDLSLPFDPYTGPDVEETLPYIVWSGRTQLMLENRIGLSGVRCLSDLPIDGHCFSASKYIKRLCDHVGIACQRVEFFPGFSHKDDISWNYQCHDFNIVCIDSTLYLVDITFAQFFHKCDNLPDRLGILGLEGPSVGYYMMRLEGGETLAGELCINGYAKFDDVFKTYMDAFVLATRNGCYYEKNGILLPREGILPDSLSIYDQATYMRFLFTPDSLVNYEDRDGLGKQRKLLMDPNYQFFS